MAEEKKDKDEKLVSQEGHSVVQFSHHAGNDCGGKWDVVADPSQKKNIKFS